MFKFPAEVTLVPQSVPPICEDCDEQDEPQFKSGGFKQYEIKDTKHIWWRVACVNLVDDPSPDSIIGPTGHIERANFWTHVIGALIYLVYFMIRPLTPNGAVGTLSSHLAAVSYISFVVTFSLSSIYHIYSANPFWSTVTRFFDYFGIYIGIAFGTLSDLAIVSNNLEGLRFQAVADVFIGMVILLLFFAIRRTTLTVEETRLAYLSTKCNLGIARSTNTDLEHSSLRAAAGTTLSFSWILVATLAFENLEEDCAWVFVGSRIAGTSILVGGMLLDNFILYPDAWFENDKKPNCVCYSTKPGVCGGWAITSHALWHILAVLATLVTSVGSEYVVAFSDNLKF